MKSNYLYQDYIYIPTKFAIITIKLSSLPSDSMECHNSQGFWITAQMSSRGLLKPWTSSKMWCSKPGFKSLFSLTEFNANLFGNWSNFQKSGKFIEKIKSKYCWWKNSCTSWYGSLSHWLQYRGLHPRWLAGFLMNAFFFDGRFVMWAPMTIRLWFCSP